MSTDGAPRADLPVHARERLQRAHDTRFFTSDLSVNEFLLVKEVGFDPMGLVMGSSIYQIAPATADPQRSHELESLTQAMYDARDAAMIRLEEEAEALGADGVIGVRLTVRLQPWGEHIAEFLAIGTAVRHRGGAPFRNQKGRPFTSDLSGQQFWTLLRAGFRPVGFVMGNCVYYVAPGELMAVQRSASNRELLEYTHALYDAREHAVERLQAEAEALAAEGVVGVVIEEKQHGWEGATITTKTNTSTNPNTEGSRGRVIELLVMGTAVVATKEDRPVPVPALVIDASV
jgi:uncharacterized protein YbjQ (UPF0145 family)